VTPPRRRETKKGFRLEAVASDTVELRSVYDAKDSSLIDVVGTGGDCRIGKDFNKNATCTVRFVVPADMEPPILVHYELGNFHQNHRFYSRSKDVEQLAGAREEERSTVNREFCEPLETLGGIVLNPCGFVANTFFNDKISLIGGNDADGDPLEMSEEGIAWRSDLEYKYDFPGGFETRECPDPKDCAAGGGGGAEGNSSSTSTCCQDFGFSCDKPVISKKDQRCYAYHYPNADTTRYLYQTYPDIVSPLEHVRNEHFVVWMRLETRPTFRKLYGWIDRKISEGEVLEFEIWSNYAVESFGGHKALVLSTTNTFGGKNSLIGVTFYSLGFTFLSFGIFFALKHWFRPRKIADRKYLHYKED